MCVRTVEEEDDEDFNYLDDVLNQHVNDGQPG